MVDIDLDIIVEKPVVIKLFGVKKILKDLSMDEDFNVKRLRQEIGEVSLEKKDEKKYHQIKRELLQLLIEPISEEEVGKLKKKQFDQLLNEIDFMDMRDQGVVNSKEEYNKLKLDITKQNMNMRGDGTLFPMTQ